MTLKVDWVYNDHHACHEATMRTEKGPFLWADNYPTSTHIGWKIRAGLHRDDCISFLVGFYRSLTQASKLNGRPLESTLEVLDLRERSRLPLEIALRDILAHVPEEFCQLQFQTSTYTWGLGSHGVWTPSEGLATLSCSTAPGEVFLQYLARTARPELPAEAYRPFVEELFRKG